MKERFLKECNNEFLFTIHCSRNMAQKVAKILICISYGFICITNY